MQSCCNFTYEKYIDKDGKIDDERLKALMKERYGEVRLYEKTCECECHKDGVNCLH